MNEIAKIKGTFAIQKSLDEKRLAFGWASVAQYTNGIQADIIEPQELEQAAYNFIRFYREGGEMHQRRDCAVLIESMVFTPEKTKELGIPDGALPAVGWWIGFYVTDDEVWEKVKSGEYLMFSIEGEAIREEVNDT